MSKKSYPRRLGESEAKASVRTIQVTPRKVNLLAGLIRGKTAQAAKAELAFSKRRVASEVLKALDSAIANAENNHQLDVDRLVVHEASVGRAFTLSRFHTRGRGKVAHIEKYFSNLTVIVHERQEEKA